MTGDVMNPYESPECDGTRGSCDTRQRLYALIPFLIAGSSGIVALVLSSWAIDRDIAGIAFGIIFAVLVYDVPVCIWVLVHWLTTGRPPELSLSPLTSSREEREYRRTLRQRPKLSDEEFYQTFYSNSDIPPGLPGKLRRVTTSLIGVDLGAIHPRDNLFHACNDLDWGILLDEVDEEFGVHIPRQRIEGMDGSFDSLLQELALVYVGVGR